MGNSNVLVKDCCLECKNLYRHLESGSCSCSDYAKGKSQAEISWLRRRGRLVEIKKPYRMADVEEPLKKVLAMAQKLAEESSILVSVTKCISERAEKRSRKVKVRKARGKAKSTITNMERSKADFERGRKKSLKKSEDTVILGCLDGSIKSGEIVGWIEKRAGLEVR
jgi:hypothetical protein